ncbi:MAG: DUF2490 domain-containing protein [Bacteroidales bacterium]|nr:DUF2490 domain-containing protein [Bacteroidales bacterium]MBO7378209.1 DUF2490 domain-containing protein [Bacteroidales bacterium]
MKTCKILAALLLAAVSMPLMAEGDDFGMWGEVNLEKKINKRWSLDAGLEYRSRNELKSSDRWSLGLDASYRINDWLKASAGYSLLDDHRHKVNNSGKKYADYWGLRHRTNLTLTASKSFGDLNISLRERWQYTYRPEKTVQRYYTADGSEADEKTFSSKSKNVWRNRLQLKYKLTSTWRPYLNAETSVSAGLEKIRYAAGTEIRLSKSQSFDLKYIYQALYNNDDNESNRHIISAGYTFKF